MVLATLQKKKAGNIKALEPKTFVRTSCLGVRFTGRRQLVMAADTFTWANHLETKELL